MMLTPLEQRQAEAMSLAFNLLSARAVTDLIEEDKRIDQAVERGEELGLLNKMVNGRKNLLLKQLNDERKAIEALFLAAGTFHEDRGISA